MDGATLGQYRGRPPPLFCLMEKINLLSSKKSLADLSCNIGPTLTYVGKSHLKVIT